MLSPGTVAPCGAVNVGRPLTLRVRNMRKCLVPSRSSERKCHGLSMPPSLGVVSSMEIAIPRTKKRSADPRLIVQPISSPTEMISWLPPEYVKFAARMPTVRLEPLMARRTTLVSPPASLASAAPGSPPASSSSEVVSSIDSELPKPDSTIQ